MSEVVDGLDGSDFEDDSEDDFDGYLDVDECGLEEEEGELLAVQESVGAEVVGAEVVVDMDSSSTVPDSMDSSPTVPDYTLQAECSVPVEVESPLDFFSLLLTEEMLQNIVTQTNLSAQQFVETHELPPHSRVRQWSKSVHDIDELRQFLAIVLIMGLVQYPQIEHHWSTQWPYSNTHFSSVS